ncbi:4-hydroxythreonine-4-phosphate dehydrogenase PdxA [Puia dinghuensis]|uniref:4-hydroxythreonine-4-phosphate dehydrogenase n=1 Tax=Puia dinghuensis TaxID=1792502 RepID=A0A8J2XRB8_9BACT|nr:4-hydroxythreonine-4-phosphate dehydrogenase PdxA [Puia dinghuensis]GGB00098.1 hypothetical protein GCM10011511_24260 [Puia dinghuensis]
MTNKPIIGITMGDPAGFGPEIAIKALLSAKVTAICRPIIVGDAATLDYTADRLNCKVRIHPITIVAEAVFQPGIIDVLDMETVDLDKLVRGEVSAMTEHVALEAIRKVNELAMAGEINAIVAEPGIASADEMILAIEAAVKLIAGASPSPSAR